MVIFLIYKKKLTKMSFIGSQASGSSSMVSRASIARMKMDEFKKKRTIPSSKDFEGGAYGSYASEIDVDGEYDQRIRDVFNSKNGQLLKKNQELLDLGDDERNDKIREFVEENNVLIPIAPLPCKLEGLHLIGTVRTFVDVVDDQAVVRVGGGYETLEDYHNKNKRHFKQTIVDHMENSNMEYDEVVDGLLAGKKKFSNITASKLMDQPKKAENKGPE